MDKSHSDFEVRFHNRTFLKTRDGKIEINGLDYDRDIASVTRLIGLLSEVLISAAGAEAVPTVLVDGNVVRLDDFRRTAFSEARPACR